MKKPLLKNSTVRILSIVGLLVVLVSLGVLINSNEIIQGIVSTPSPTSEFIMRTLLPFTPSPDLFTATPYPMPIP